MQRKFGKNDLIFTGALLLICLVVWLIYAFAFGREGSEVVVTVDGEEFGTYSLSDEATIEITDSSGDVTNTLVIRDGKADMTEADCPDKLCVNQKAISAEKENIVCLPNRVVVTVTAADEDNGLDGFVQ